MGRNLPSLKAQWGGQARSAFQALARLQLATPNPPSDAGPTSVDKASLPASGSDSMRGVSGAATSPAPATRPVASAEALHTDWTFADLPELLELRRGGVSVVGYPALVDRGTGVAIDVFDELPVAQARHREGLGRLVSLQIRDALKYLEKNLPDLQKSAVLYMPLGTLDELRAQIIAVAIERAFLTGPLPDSADAFRERLEAGRGRLTLIANELARTANAILVEHAAALRKLRDSRGPKELADDISSQMARLVTKNFLIETPAAQIPHMTRYLKGVALRLDKWRADPQRDAARLAELHPLEQRFLRSIVQRKGVRDPRLDEFRWLLEELRVSLFAQELRTPQPVSSKRLDKVWAQLGR
jgi:ATP-dependent helicase HrpA